MAETAKILNPERIVVVPDMKAGCSLADGCPADRFRAWKARYPGAVTVSYINCSAEVKAESDYICTSSNAKKIVQRDPEGPANPLRPRQNLGRYLVKETGRDMMLWPGSCIVHETFSQRKLDALQGAQPGGRSHRAPRVRRAVARAWRTSSARPPRCSSTSQTDRAETFIVATEPGILHQMQKRAPDKTLIRRAAGGELRLQRVPVHAPEHAGKGLLALRDLAPRLEMAEELRLRAKLPIDRMLSLS